MSITNNKFKSTTVFGKLVVADTPDGSITADTILNRNLKVTGTTELHDTTTAVLNSSELITGSKGLMILAGTTDLRHTNTTSLYASGLIAGSNGLTISTGSTELQNTNIIGGLNVSTGDTQVKLIVSNNYGTNDLYQGAFYMDYGKYSLKSRNNPTGDATSIGLFTSNTSQEESETMTLNNDSIILYQPTTVNGSLTINNIDGLTTQKVTLSDTESPFIGTLYQQGSGLNLKSYNNNGTPSTTPTTINLITMNDSNVESYAMILTHNYITLKQPTKVDSDLIVTGTLNNVQYSKFDFLKNITSDIQAQINGLSTPNTINGSLNLTNSTGSGTTYKGSIIQTDNNLFLQSSNNLLTPSALDTKIFFKTMDASHNLYDSLQLSPTEALFNTLISCSKRITSNEFQAEDTSSAVTAFTQLLSTSSLKIGTESVNTEIRGSTITFVNPSSSTTMELSSNTIKINKPIELGYNTFTAPTSTCVGGLKTGTYDTTLPSNGTTKSVYTLEMPIGVWAFSGNIRYNASNIVSCKIAIVAGSINSFTSPSASRTQTVNASSVCDNINTILSVSTATTYYLTVLLNFTGSLSTTSDDLPFLRATRLA